MNFVYLTRHDGNRIAINRKAVIGIIDLKGHGPDGSMTGTRIEYGDNTGCDVEEDFDTVLARLNTITG